MVNTKAYEADRADQIRTTEEQIADKGLESVEGLKRAMAYKNQPDSE